MAETNPFGSAETEAEEMQSNYFDFSVLRESLKLGRDHFEFCNFIFVRFHRGSKVAYWHKRKKEDEDEDEEREEKNNNANEHKMEEKKIE